MPSEPIYVGAPTDGTRVVDAVFVPDDRFGSVGTWLLEFSNGAEREIRTVGGYHRRSSELKGCSEWQAEVSIASADLQAKDDAKAPRFRPGHSHYAGYTGLVY